MGTFAETAIIDYHLGIYCWPTKENKLLLSISIRSKQTEVGRLCFLCTANKQKLPFSISSVIYLYKYSAVKSRKLKSRRFSLIRLPFSHRANGSLSFVCFLTKKPMEVIRLQTDLTDLPIYAFGHTGNRTKEKGTDCNGNKKKPGHVNKSGTVPPPPPQCPRPEYCISTKLHSSLSTTTTVSGL